MTTVKELQERLQYILHNANDTISSYPQKYDMSNTKHYPNMMKEFWLRNPYPDNTPNPYNQISKGRIWDKEKEVKEQILNLIWQNTNNKQYPIPTFSQSKIQIDLQTDIEQKRRFLNITYFTNTKKPMKKEKIKNVWNKKQFKSYQIERTLPEYYQCLKLPLLFKNEFIMYYIHYPLKINSYYPYQKLGLTNKEYPLNLKTIITKEIRQKHYTNTYNIPSSYMQIDNPRLYNFYWINKGDERHLRTFDLFKHPYNPIHKITFKFSDLNADKNGLRSIKNSIAQLTLETNALQYGEIDDTNISRNKKSIIERMKNEKDCIDRLEENLTILDNLKPELTTPPNQIDDYVLIFQIKECIKYLKSRLENTTLQNLIPQKEEDKPIKTLKQINQELKFLQEKVLFEIKTPEDYEMKIKELIKMKTSLRKNKTSDEKSYLEHDKKFKERLNNANKKALVKHINSENIYKEIIYSNAIPKFEHLEQQNYYKLYRLIDTKQSST